MEEDFIITEDWIQDVLRIIFDDILGSCIEEGETFTVKVGRYITNQGPVDSSSEALSTKGNTSGKQAACRKCQIVFKKFQVKTAVKDCIVIHTNRAVIQGSKSPEKTQSLDAITTFVGALLNSNGGDVLVHIEGQMEGDKYIGFFDEFISHSLTGLIEDGQQYCDLFTRKWLSDIQGCEDFLLITVNEVGELATVDYNTKFSNDVAHVRPNLLSIRSLLSEKKTDSYLPQERGIPDDTQLLQEDRHIKYKSYRSKGEQKFEITKSLGDFVKYVWKDLKLREHVTSMSNIFGGGSYYVGIRESFHEGAKNYKTKIPDIQGCDLPFSSKKIEGELYKVLKEHTCVLTKDRKFKDTPSDLIKIHFHNREPGKFVLEVAIRHLEGIVFYDRRGPRAYTIKDGSTHRLDREEWLQRLQTKK